MYTYKGTRIEWNQNSTGAWYSLVSGIWKETIKDSPLNPAEYITYRDIERETKNQIISIQVFKASLNTSISFLRKHKKGHYFSTQYFLNREYDARQWKRIEKMLADIKPDIHVWYNTLSLVWHIRDM